MIVKKVKNPKKSASKSVRVAGLVNYIAEPQRENGQEKCIHSESLNFITTTLEGNILEMTALTQDAVRSKDPIDHWVLSWKSNEHPTVDQAREAVSIFAKHCGLEGHQMIWGLHDDTQNKHVHIAINRVHPDTLRVIEVNKGFDLNAAHQAIAIIEKKQGWTPEKNARFQVTAEAELVIDQQTKRPALLQAKDKSRQPGAKAKDMEVQTGEKSAQRIGIEAAAPVIQQAASWKDLHFKLSELGMRYERKGSGAIIFIGDVPVKASDISRAASLTSLQKRFGAYQPAKEIKLDEYFHHPAGRTQASQQDFAALGKNPGNCMRSLSECRMVSLDGKKESPGVLSVDARARARPFVRLRRHAGGGGLNPQPMHQGQTGWNEYIAIRDEQRLLKAQSTATLSSKHDAERRALFAKLKEEKSFALQGNWKGKGEDRNALVSTIAVLQTAQKIELQESHRAERKALQAAFKPLPVYKEWKDRPQIVSMNMAGTARQEMPSLMSQTLRSLTHTTDQRGHVTYSSKGQELFRDEGRMLAILNPQSPEAVAASLLVAQTKFGSLLTLTGDKSFQEKAVVVAVENNLSIKFTNPEMEALRSRLQAEKYQSQRAARKVQPIEHRKESTRWGDNEDQPNLPQPQLVPDKILSSLDLLKQKADEIDKGKPFYETGYKKNEFIAGKIIAINDTHFVVSERNRKTILPIESLSLSTNGTGDALSALVINNLIDVRFSERPGDGVVKTAKIDEQRKEFKKAKQKGVSNER
jgi:hypothetical protein